MQSCAEDESVLDSSEDFTATDAQARGNGPNGQGPNNGQVGNNGNNSNGQNGNDDLGDRGQNDARNQNSNLVQQWSDVFLELDRYATGMRPNATARAIAYINLAAYEVAIPFLMATTLTLRDYQDCELVKEREVVMQSYL